jgi:tRNA(Arg) A34 adenosine deaminase TadA
MTQTMAERWAALPPGAQAALHEQWLGLAAGGLPCGAAITTAAGEVVARGRNYSYDAPGELTTRQQYPLQHNRLAHAEMNALALLTTETDHNALSLWATQNPCAMCAAAIAFTDIGKVVYLADDPSDDSSLEVRLGRRDGIAYQAFGDPFWWAVSNLLFLYMPTTLHGVHSSLIRMNTARYPALVQLTLQMARAKAFDEPAHAGSSLPEALQPFAAELEAAAAAVPQE